MATDEQANALREAISKCVENEIDGLLKNPDWGALNFEDCRREIETVFSTIKPLLGMPLERLEGTIVPDLTSHVEDLSQKIENIKGFTINQADPPGTRQNLANELQNSILQVWNRVAPWLAYLAYQSGSLDENVKQLAALRSEAEGILNEAKSEIEVTKKEIDKIVIAARDSAGKVGVAHHTVDFAGEADGYETVAHRWLLGTAVMAAATVVSVLLLWKFLPIPPKVDTAFVIQVTATKFVVIGLFLTATLWCGHLYKTSKHQESVNKHRANALKTFQTFVEAASDPSVRDAVLLETTRSIFAITSSGYLGRSDSAADGSSKIVEVVKSFSGKEGD